MPLRYLDNGNLTPGIHETSWADFVNEFGYNMRRRDIIEGLEQAITDLTACGCTAFYVDGSFVSKNRNPRDFDMCWDDRAGIDWKLLRKTYPQLEQGSADLRKSMYHGDVKPAFCYATEEKCYLEFFQKDKDGTRKGIIKIIVLKTLL